MNHLDNTKQLPPAQRVTDKALQAFEKFLHIEAVGGIILLVAALAALILANSSYASAYEHFWHLSLSFALGDFKLSTSLHFLINDILMTVFFLVVGMEIRREIHEGALSNVRVAILPIVAAMGGVIVPALIYLSLNHGAGLRDGWAIPTATDIAFAVGILTLLGKAVPVSVRIFLLTLAIIDDIVAVLVIALFYSGGLDLSGFLIAGCGILIVLFFQWIGLGSAYIYLLPGTILWYGLFKAGAHPTLAGVILGLMTPVVAVKKTQSPLDMATQALAEFSKKAGLSDSSELMHSVKRLGYAQRELLPPVTRLQLQLHPWVAYVIMPIFAFANAGVSFNGINLSDSSSFSVFIGVTFGLVMGKAIGVFTFTWVLVRTGLSSLPDGMNWMWVLLIGLLAGIGFTMSMFIVNLAFTIPTLISAAKLGVLAGTFIAAVIGLIFGRILILKYKSVSVS